MELSSPENLQAEAAAADVANAKSLPILRAYRENLEKQEGALTQATRRHHLIVGALGIAMALAAIYSLWGTLGGSPPILGWVVTAVFAISAAAVARNRSSSERERTRHLDELHDKMASAGRRIDVAERRLRS